MKNQNYASRSYSKSTTTSIRSYDGNTPAPRYGNGSYDLSRATSHVLRSNPRTQATGVAVGAFAAVTAVCGVAALALDIIAGGRRY